MLQFGAHDSMPPGAADVDSTRSSFLLPVIQSIPDAAYRYLRDYTPRTITASKRESVADFVRDAVAALAPLNVFTVEQVAAPITRLVNWAHVANGLPLRYVVLLSPAIVERFLTEVTESGELSAGTARNYRAHLARVASALGVQVSDTPAPIRRTVRAEPYTEEELRAWRLWARTRPTALSKARADVTLALIAGAGLHRDELLTVKSHHVIVDHDDVWIRVTGARQRVVPLLPQWRNRLLRNTQGLASTDSVWPLGGTASAVTTSMKGSAPAPEPQRLRASWLVTHLSAGTSAEHLLAWSGIERGETLAGYLQFLNGPIDENRRRTLLRTRADEVAPTATLRLWEMPRIEISGGANHERGGTAQ